MLLLFYSFQNGMKKALPDQEYRGIQPLSTILADLNAFVPLGQSSGETCAQFVFFQTEAQGAELGICHTIHLKSPLQDIVANATPVLNRWGYY